MPYWVALERIPPSTKRTTLDYLCRELDLLVTANDGRGFACVADTVGVSGTDGLSTATPHFVCDMVMKPPFGSLGRNRRVASVCGAPDSVTVFKAGFGPSGL